MPVGQEILLIFDPPDLPSREEFVVLRNQLPTANFRFAQPLNLVECGGSHFKDKLKTIVALFTEDSADERSEC